VVLSGPGAQPIVAPVSTQNSELVCMHMCTIFLVLVVTKHLHLKSFTVHICC
jgi:hypothetical protein